MVVTMNEVSHTVEMLTEYFRNFLQHHRDAKYDDIGETVHFCVCARFEGSRGERWKLEHMN